MKALGLKIMKSHANMTPEEKAAWKAEKERRKAEKKANKGKKKKKGGE